MQKFFSNILIVSIFLFLSKLLGFVRDLLLASFFGSGAALQAFLVAFRFPEFIRKVTSSGTLTQIINPYLNASINQRNNKFIITILYFIALFLLIVTFLAIVFSNIWVGIYAYGFVDETSVLVLVKSMFVIMIPYVLFNGVMGVISAILNSYSKYVVSSLLPIVLNVVMIIGVDISPRFNVPIYSVAYAVLLAGIIQVSIGGYSLIKLIGKISFSRDIFLVKDSRAKIFLRKLPSAFLGTAILQINGLVETFFASFLLSGSLAWLYYADRVNQFLYGVFGTAIATVMIPYLIDCKRDKQQFFKTLAAIIRFTLLVTIPAIVGLFVLAKPIVISLFYYGKFSLNDVDFTYLAMLGYLMSLFCFVVVRVIVSALYAQNKTTIVFYISLVSLITTICLDIFIVHFFSGDKYAFVYLALASSSVALLNLFIQLWVLCDFSFKLFIVTYLPFMTIVKIIIASTTMVLVLKLFNLSDSYWITLSMFGRLKSIALIVFIGVCVYLVTILLLVGIKPLKTLE
ncbi:murein biosynthesis integral membrane protein MurJ [Francisella tularensis]|uniref:murein biosynthesis integral membrane protein MurJ n=1 Tax=Francisella tularensis TaxID=263 RepID=UPI000173E2E1|nr:murein biosynthesis integral membrane protein MurJ [Francisella tularensis]ACD30348.1 multidrug/oligosaccharidyl-lipid/polysaccharide (MOP) transporter [Francisella tularensis subsp. mediasiatica FSC147]MBK2078321.1 murein biosynthesis integral membrane protein MurJ [Francisella tularensis subsp. mediasiatica]MBK2101882.1 murein biosynthesis integral membrane protein MurJ [Francisella tularensis subsp. mediasiatica]MBK2105263.1 murein biosynthesis integral membrane protein MurJ [Francisella 